MRGPRTSRTRVVLAVLAGALVTPLLYATMIFVASDLWNQAGATDMTLAALVVGVIFGAPLVLLGILVLFAPIWLWRHRQEAPFVAFLLAGTLVSLLAGIVVPVVGVAEPIMTAMFGLSAALSTSLMWWIAYGSRDLTADASA
ncbi:MAG: hypothetical protein Q7T61_14290 [Caulobacter sp.]|nr:hypothetical protein [Caulobacter sp.]